MTKKQQHEFFLKEIKNLGNGVVEHLIIMDKDKFEKLKQQRIK